MGLDTEITGSPASVRGASTYLSGSLRPAVDDGADALVGARSLALSDWGGDSGPAFSAQMRTGATGAEGLSTTVQQTAGALDAFAAALETAQGRMSDIRADARAAGLVVSGFVVQEPGAGPANPGPPPTGDLTVQQAEQYDARVAEWNRHQELITAWNTAVAEAETVQADYDAACTRLQDEYLGQSGEEMVLTATDVAGGVAAAAGAVRHVSILRGSASAFAADARTAFARMDATDYRTYGQHAHRMFYGDLEHAQRMQGMADDAARAADDAARNGHRGLGRLSTALSRVLVVGGIALDLHDGEGPVQAVASNVGGYAVGAGAGTLAAMGSSVAMGAAFGSVVPGVGTAVGALVGAGVGIFASGAIDSLFENGPDVGQALSEGWESVTDTGSAIVDGAQDLAEGVGDFVGGLFD